MASSAGTAGERPRGRRGSKATAGAPVLALAAGGPAWGFGPGRDDSGEVPAGTRRGPLAAEEAGEFFDGAALEFGGRAAVSRALTAPPSEYRVSTPTDTGVRDRTGCCAT